MAWLVILLLSFAAFHFLLFVPIQLALIGALVLTAVLWLVWKLKWVILAVIGLEELFGGRGDSA
jgi:hypothetical protein